MIFFKLSEPIAIPSTDLGAEDIKTLRLSKAAQWAVRTKILLLLFAKESPKQCFLKPDLS